MVSPRGEEMEDKPPCSCPTCRGHPGQARLAPRGGFCFFPKRLVPAPRRVPDVGVQSISFSWISQQFD